MGIEKEWLRELRGVGGVGKEAQKKKRGRLLSFLQLTPWEMRVLLVGKLGQLRAHVPGCVHARGTALYEAADMLSLSFALPGDRRKLKLWPLMKTSVWKAWMWTWHRTKPAACHCRMLHPLYVSSLNPV